MKKAEKQPKKVDLLHKGYTKIQKATQIQKKDPMLHSYSCKIIVREKAIRKDGTIPIILRAMIHGEHAPITIPVYCLPQEFNIETGQVKYPKKKDPTGEETALANALIDQYRYRARKIFLRYTDKEMRLDRIIFVREFHSRTNLEDFYAFIEKNIISELTGSRSAATIKLYRYTLNLLMEFQPTCNFSELNEVFVQRFDLFMQRKKLAQNTRMKYHKDLKFFCNQARLHKQLDEDVYARFQIKRIKGSRSYLDRDQIARLMELYHKKSMPDHVLNVLKNFLFSCLTGVRISDLKVITDENLIDDALVFKPVKTKYTDRITRIPLPQAALTLVDKNRKGPLFSCPADQTSNQYLKIIAAEAGIQTNLSTHIARHSFAIAFIELNNGDVATLQQILGHSKIETTMEYIKISQAKLKSGMRSFDQEFLHSGEKTNKTADK